MLSTWNEKHQSFWFYKWIGFFLTKKKKAKEHLHDRVVINQNVTTMSRTGNGLKENTKCALSIQSTFFFIFIFLKKRLYVYLSHPFFYDLGSQVITPTLHAELVSTLQAGKILYNTSMSTLYGLKTGHGATHQKQLCIWSDSTEDAWQLSDRYWGRGKKMTSQYG